MHWYEGSTRIKPPFTTNDVSENSISFPKATTHPPTTNRTIQSDHRILVQIQTIKVLQTAVLLIVCNRRYVVPSER